MVKRNRVYAILIILLSTIIVGYSQTDQSTETPKKEIQWNKLKREFALDCRSIDLSGKLGAIGTNLIFRKYFGEKKFIAIDERKAYRLQLGGSVSYPVSKLDSLKNILALNEIRYFYHKYVNVRALAGVEWQQQMKRLQLYYGFDAGVGYFINENSSNKVIYFNNGEIYSYSTQSESIFSIPIYGFVGVKYYIHPRVSFSLESSLNTGISWSKLEDNNVIINTNEVLNTVKLKSTNLLFGTNYVRFINVSFHF